MTKRPFSVEKTLTKAKSLIKKGELELAAKTYQSVLVKFPNNQSAKHGLFKLAQLSDKVLVTDNEKKKLFQLHNKRNYSAAFNYAITLSNTAADDPFLSNMIGVLHTQLGRKEEAVSSYKKAIQLDNSYIDAYSNLGGLLLQMNKPEEALSHYRQAQKIGALTADGYYQYAAACFMTYNYRESLTQLKSALSLEPNYLEAIINMGSTFNQLGETEEAIKCFQKALTIKPNNAELHCNLANSFLNIGEKKLAIKHYKQSIKNNPTDGSVHRNLSRLKNYTTNDLHIAEMEKLLKNEISQEKKSELHFALGEAYEKCDQFQTSFNHYQQGNSLRKAALNYKSAIDKTLFKQLMHSTDNIQIIGNLPKSNKRPIFIVGMPRSGTTLVEQIISSHSQVFGAGELPYLKNIIHSAFKKGQPRDNLTPDPLSTNQIGIEYLKKLDNLNVNETFITDKMPSNFRFLGFIFKLLPNIKVINVNRNPMAVSWSIFKNYFPTAGMGFAYDLEDIAQYYVLYKELMGYWELKFPNLIHNIEYDSLVNNQEEETLNLLNFCKLEWEQQCMDFHLNPRAVRTASSLQIRNKIYKDSSSAWEKYHDQLLPLKNSLTEYQLI